MGEDEIKAGAKKVRVTIEQAIGKLTGKSETRTGDAADKLAPTAESTRDTAKEQG